MAELKSEKVEVIKVEYYDLEVLVNKIYGQVFSFEADEELGSEAYKLYKVDGNVSGYEEKGLINFKKDGSGMYMTDILLNDMCRKGIIKEGNYLIYTL
ncbi:MAG: hypothetical protein KKA79_06230 [Nanoarchaeota archaeon]|nr:hypothetical protein [Nanoarchaeota archaeon]MCG2717394.1 hypothetical protein [Nanoarchaeota archaeon]